MAAIFETILNKLNTATYFVFPSETTAAHWARKICLFGEVRSLSPERFLAWDRFKEQAISLKEKNRKPVSAVIRRLFALSLAKKNAEQPFLKEIIPLEFAENSRLFADFIASMLSSLGRWEKLHTFPDDGEDRDIRIIKTSYAAFMQENSLFEPSWETINFQNNNNRYIIFFHEVLEDFNDFKEALGVPEIELYSCNEAAQNIAEQPTLNFFDSSPQEIRNAVLEIRRLRDEGLPFEEIALTLPDYKNCAPYVERELALHDIPFNSRSGKNLGEYPAGRLFSLVNECSASYFSFDAVKRLLLDNSIPWNDTEKNEALIKYGIENHCAAPFRDSSPRARSRIADAWENGFKQKADKDLEAYYGDFKKAVLAMTGAKSFRKILEQYYVFRSLLNMEKCSAESDAVLARCIEELSVLIEAEESFPSLAISAPFEFYISHLKKKNYVYVRKEEGINLYDYPVAAGAPFGCHILINVSQAAAVVQHSPLPFLRKDKRARLGITDSDASAAMLSLYVLPPFKEYHCRTSISASEKTYAGWAIPHSAFAQNQIKAVVKTDLYAEERQWQRNSSKLNQNNKPVQLHAIQKEGFKKWSEILLQAQSAEAGNHCTGIAAQQLREMIQQKNAGKTKDTGAELSVSASDLNDFFTCPTMWLYHRIFHLEKTELDASLLDAESLGLIYHKILERLYERIQITDRCFFSKNLNTYFSWLEEISASVLRSNDTLRGPLVYPLLAPLAAAINRKLRAFLKTEARVFDGFEIKELEQGYQALRGKLLLNGYIDRISEGPQGPVIIDYKTGNVPAKSHCRWNEKDDLLDFQIPMYIKLFETVTGNNVGSALFGGIRKNEFVSVVGAYGKEDFSREEYQSTIDALETAIENFENAVTSLRFGRENTHITTCTKCSYRTMCRSQYHLNPAPDRCIGNYQEGEENGE